MVFKTDSYNVSQLGGRKNLLRTVYKDGELLIDDDFATIRERANKDGFDDFYGII